MANGANIVVPVGVQLELNNVQEIISSLQKAMSNVKPDTKGYAGIVSELSKAEKRAESLASKLSQGFTTKAGLQSFTKGFEDLIAMVDVVNNKVGQINFDNLTLTADQQAKMNEFTKNIQDARDAYNAFETDKLRDAVSASQDLQNVFKRLNLNIDTTSLDSAINSIKTKIASLQKEMDTEAKKATTNEARAASRQSEIDELNRLKKLFTSKDLSKTFPEFFKDTGDFKKGGNQALVNLLKQLGIDNDTIELVKKTAGKKIKEIQAEMEKAINTRIKTKESQRNTASDNAKAARDAVERLTAEQKENINSQQELQNVQNNPEMVQARKQETDAIEQENVKIRELIQLIMQAFNGGLGKNSNDLKAALDAVRESGGAAAAELENLNQRTKTVENIKRSVSMWMGFNQVLRLTRTAIKNVVKDIRDLDKVMTEIAVVTNMSQKDLWNQMNTYQAIAKQYGVATTGVYQVSQIYYQQGLQTSDVMALTNETLKMAKIAGLDYGAAADYMTVAIRGFKMEMTDAQNVVDVYSNLAAKSASDTTELATAMSKTASSAAAVGSSFENTSAMIAMMVETTRESAENIGSALKSIISRYGEMTSDPSKLVDSEGEALSLNKVDKALQSVGISLHNAQGQFRDFDEVILELSSKWDTLDKNSQRYIATVMAGNRQQSRFLALVSDYDRLSELTEVAANSEDAALVQTLKTMDSLETKIQNVKNAFQGFYGNLGLENVFKGALDVITNVINRLNAMPKAFDKIPIAAIGMVANIINVIKTLGTTLITVTTAKWQQISEIIKENIAKGFKEGTDEGTQYAENGGGKVGSQYNKKRIGVAAAGRALSMAGTAASTYALTIGDNEAIKRGTWEIGGGIATGIGQGIATGAMIGGPWGAALGGIAGVVSAFPSLVAGINDVTHAEELRIKAMRESAEKSNQEAILAKSEARNLENTVEKIEKLSEAKNESNEAYQEWLDYVNQIASNYPELISMYDSEGNAVINMAEAYEKLAQSRTKAAQASLDAQIDSLKTQQAEIKRMQEITNENIDVSDAGDKLGKGLSNIYGAALNEFGDLEIGLNSNEIANIAKKYLSDIFEEILLVIPDSDQGTISQFKLKASGIDAVQNWTAEDFGGSKENLEIARNAMADLFYEQFIKPLAKEGYLSDIGFENEEDIQKLVEGWDPEDIVQKYLDIMSQINETVQSNAELEEKVGELEEKKRSADLALQKWAENNISAIDGFSKEKVSKFSGDSFMQTILEKNMPEKYVTNNGFNAAGQAIINDLFDFYNQIDEDTYKEITSILAHPENYTSKLDLRAALAQTLGNGELTEKLIEYITKTGEDGTSYLTDIWEKQVESLRSKFQSNLSGSKQNKNLQIQEAIDKILKVGNGKIRNGSDLEGEIAAQYLNNINKQWTDLVTKQKNEAVATQNAEFLADTYLNVGELSEEANGAMANILSTAELNTREGIQNAIDQIEQYQTNNEVSSEDATKLESILANLRQHKADLLLNLNTEIQSYVDSLSDAIENIGKNYSNNVSGFSKLSDANEVLQKINNEKIKTGEEQLNFNDVFTFDKTLGKYVFTIKGLIEANNQVIKDLDSQYEDTIDQLNQEKDIFSEITSENGLGSDIQKNKGDKTKVINALKEASDIGNYTDEQQSYLEDLAIRYEQSGKEWDVFIESERKRLDQLGINIDQAHEAMLKMTVEAQQREAFKAIDFSAIVNGSQSFEEAEQSFLNYYATQINQDLPEWLQNIQMNLAKVTSKVAFNAIKMGGQGGLNMYRLLAAVTGQETDKNTENEIYNARVKAISSLHNKMQKAAGQERIQLDDAERTVLGVTSRDIGATELAEKYSQLIDEVRQGVKNGQTDIETANAAIIDEEFSDELSLNKQTSALTSIGTSKITPESIKTLANTIGVLKDLPDDFDIKQLKGLNKEGFITNIDEFLNSFNDLLVNKLTDSELDNIASSLELADKSKITDAAVQAENSIIESIASEINNIKSAGIDKKVNLTYLQNKLGDNSLTKIFGSAYQDGMLTVTETVKANMYTSLQTLRSELKANNYDTSELDKTLIEYVNSSISEISEFTGAMTVSDNTAQVLASQSAIFKGELLRNGKITLKTAESFARAANAVYTATTEQYQKGLANLTQLNSSYANIIKSNLAKQTAGFNMLTSASKIDLTSLQNFLNVYNKKLSDYVNRMGKLTTAGANAGLQSLGNGNYQIADWHKFINQLQITANELSTEYIDAYVSWLQSDANVAPNAKEALMTSLVPNMEKLTYAQIGQIAKTFNMTVDAVLALVENNGDNTFNGANLLNSLDFDKSNKEFSKALIGQKQTLASNLIGRMTAYIEAGSDGKLTSYDTQALSEGVNDYIKGMHALGISVEINSQKMRDILSGGGENAVVLAQRIAAESGQQLSNQDIETLYRSSISSYVNAIDTVMAKPGEIVDRTTANLIRDNGGKVNQLGTTGQFVVESVANLYEAYNNLLQKMVATGEATLADLNKVQALALENRLNENGTNEQQVIDALGDAAGMTFTRFGEILADAGIQLTEDMVNQLKAANIIDFMGGNKMKIVDFQAFADLMGWDANSEEYISAFKTYNDSMIQMNRQAERNILEEAQNVASAKGGDWVNITQLWDKLTNTIAESTEDSDIMAIAKLRSAIEGYGGQIEDGILKLDDSANIPAIMQEIAQAAAESGGLLSNELAELADAVADAIKGYADLISGGIEGSLSNVQAEELQDWATANGIGQLDFTETKDGLKVATDQAFELVAALQQVDSMQGKLTFDSLVDSLSEDKGGRFENISKTTAEIAKAQRQIAENEEEIRAIRKHSEGDIETDKRKINNLVNQNKQLKEQIGLYREIQQHQSIDPSQYNFMDRDLPDVMQGPINYWNSVGEAFSTMNESAKTGRMGIQDFYNIVNEMSNLIATSGQPLELAGVQLDGSAERAAELIQKGMGSLTNIDGKGVMVNLKNLGINFAAGADGAKQNFADGVHSLAESQVAMLDAAIKVLEVVVAMEQLGDVDVNSDNQLNLGEIFTLDDKDIPTDWNKTYTDAIGELLEKAEKDKELSDALESVKIGGRSMMEYLKDTEKTFVDASAEWEKLGMSAEMYQQIMNGFYQAMAKGDYNLDTIQDSVWETLANYLPDGMTIELPDRTIVVAGEEKFIIDWQKPEVQNAVDMIEKEKEITEEEAKEELEQYFTKYQANNSDNQFEVLSVLVAKNKLKIDDDGNIILPNGEVAKPGTYQYNNAVAEAALEDAGIEKGSRVVYSNDAGTAEVYGTIKIGDVEIEAYADGLGNIHYKSNYTGEEYDSLQALEEAEVKKRIEEEKANGNNVSYGEAYELLYKQPYKFKAQIEGDFTDPTFAQKAREIVEKGRQQIWDDLKKAGTDGNRSNTYEISEDEKTVTFDFNGVKVTVENTGNLQDDLDTALGELANGLTYSDLITQIQTGITNAFSSDTVSTAIVTAIQTALGIGQQEGAEGAGIPISGITLAPQGLTIKTEGIEPTISGAEESSEVPIPEVTLTPESLVLQLKGLEPTPEGGKDTQEITGGKAEIQPTSITVDVDGSTPTAEGQANTQEVPYGAITLKPASITVDTSSFDATSVAQEIATAIQNALNEIKLIPPKVGSQQNDKGQESQGDTSSTSTIKVVIDDSEANSKLDALDEKANAGASKVVRALTDVAESKVSTLQKKADASANKTVNANTDNAMRKVGALDTNANASASKTVSVTIDYPSDWIELDDQITKKVKIQLTGDKVPSDSPAAKGNVSLAKGNTGVALSRGRTLMGELGPELVVSNGHYFVVGGSGPEMVNLAPDAIVFNHLQTRQLLENGKTGTHGKPVTNERKATSFATGNVSGVAMASASAALAVLKQLRAMWASLMNASLADMGGMPKGSGGGGGGGGGGKDTAKYVEGINAEVERWYNWLKAIEETQNRINILTKEYSVLEAKGAGSKERANNLKEQFKNLQKNYNIEKALVKEQEKYRTNLIKTANKGFMSAFYHADPKTGQVYLANDEAFGKYVSSQKNADNNIKKQLEQTGKISKGTKIKRDQAAINQEFKSQFKNKISKKQRDKLSDEDKKLYRRNKKGKYVLKKNAAKTYAKSHSTFTIDRDIKTGLDFIEELQATNKNGTLKHDAKEQLKMIKALGLYDEKDLMAGVDKSQEGWEAQVVQNFLDKVESDKTEIEALNQSIQEQSEAALENEQAMVEINNQLKEMSRPVQGVTDHLERWYNWSRKIAASQHELNLLTTKYSKLQNKLGNNQKDQVENLKKQAEQTKKQLDNSINERKERQAQWKKDLKKAGVNFDKDGKIKSGQSLFNGLYTIDENGNIVYNKNKKINGGKGKFKITKKSLALDKEGNYIKDYDSLSTYVNLKDSYDSINKVPDSLKKYYNKNGKLKKDYKEIRNSLKNSGGITKELRDKQEKIMKENELTSAENKNKSLSTKLSVNEYNSLDSKTKKNYREAKNGTGYILTDNAKKNRSAALAKQTKYDEAKEIVDAYDKGLNKYIESKEYKNLNVSDPEKFLNELTATDKYGNSIYNEQQQAEILGQAGFEKEMQYVNGVKYFDSWETATQEEKNAAAKAYLEYIREIPEKWNEAKDKIDESVETEEELKNKILEINNSIREMLKPTAGITEHLESWYKWTRQTTNAQNKLNKLQAQYNNLQKQQQLGQKVTDKNFADILKKQGKQIEAQREANEEELTMRKAERNKERKKVTSDAVLKKFFTKDNNGDIVYNDEILKTAKELKGKTVKVEEIERDENGREIRVDSNGKKIKYGKKGYDEETNIVSTKFKEYKLSDIFGSDILKNGITPQELIETLTETDAAGNAIHSLELQMAILDKMDVTGKDLVEFGNGEFANWEEATKEQRLAAVENFLNTAAQIPEKINALNDAIKDGETKAIEYEGSIADINLQLKELATIATGIKNPFEEWHSWLLKIKREQAVLNLLTKQNNNLQKERINNGADIAKNLKQQLDSLKQQQANNSDYLKEREKDYNESLNTDNWTNAQKKFFNVVNNRLTYNEEDFKKQIKNRNGITLTGGIDGNGIYNYKNIKESINFSATGIEDFLKELTKQNADNSMKYNADQQFAILKAFGFGDFMSFDSSGNSIFKNGIDNATKEERETAVKTVLDNLKSFQDKVEQSADEIQSLKETELDLKGNVIDIKNQIQDNEVSLENKIMQAIEDREQRRIDELNKQKNMLSEAADKFINGLSEQLEKEQKMYEKQENQEELTKLQRQLAILQRSGGSSSQIRSLQDQIKSQQKDMYFDERQDQIDAIKEASDKQIEKLDRQIQIAEETLAFNKENGLYWKEVREIMAKDSNAILSFIETNLAERKSQSTLQADLAITEDGKIIGTYTGTKGMQFKTGGLADYTGPAWLDGTKKHPESILNAEQTNFLRNKLIDNLQEFSLAIDQLTQGTLNNNLLKSMDENAAINIEQLEFTMKVDSLANDYEAKRAGQQAFEEMMRIARKAGNRSISRR